MTRRSVTERQARAAAGARAKAIARSAPAGAGSAEVPALWLQVLQTLAGGAAHEIRGALNGVAVNLEVVRMRSERPGAAGAGGPFLGNALEQLELLTARTEALLDLARAPAAPFDVRSAARRLVALLEPAAHASGGSLEMVDESDGAMAITSADPATARLALAAAMLGTEGGDGRLLCRIVVRDAIIVRVEGVGSTPALTPDLVRVAREAGVGIERAPDATILVFPANAR